MEEKKILAKEDVQWIGVRMLDTNSNAFIYDGQHYKAILPTAQPHIQDAKFDQLLHTLYEEGFIPQTVLSNLHIDGYTKIYSQYTEHFTVPLKHSNLLVLKEAALLYIKMNLWLYKRGLMLMDGHVSNIVIQKLDAPYWCDIGSIVHCNQYNELAGIEEFLNYFIYPLLLRSKSYALEDMMRFSIEKGLSPDAVVSLNLITDPINFAENRCEVLELLEEMITSLEFTWAQTLWSDYGMKVDLDTSIPDIIPGGHNRKAMVMRLLKTLAPKTVIDLGANAGSFSRLAASLGAQVLALEPDDTAVARGHLHLREFGADGPIKFVSTGLFHTHQTADVAIALALTHHVFLTDQFSWKHIAEILAKHTDKHLITEFMPNGLGGAEMQKNLPPNYTLENFVDQLKILFNSVEVIDYLHVEEASPRILLLCLNKK